MKTLIINADDFGIAPGVNRGIIDAAQAGVVTSTSVMVSAAYVNQSIALLNESGVSIGLGLHIVLDGKLPTFSKSPRFTSKSGYLPLSEWDSSNEEDFLNEMRYEVRSQFEAFERLTGKRPDHLDSHHNICFKHPLLERITYELLEEFNIPIRDPAKINWLSYNSKIEPENQLLANLKASGIKVVRTLRDFRGDGANLDTLRSLLRNIPETGIYEIMCHAGYVDDILKKCSSYNLLREKELNVLLNPEIKEVIQEEDIHLVSYSEAFNQIY